MASISITIQILFRKNEGVIFDPPGGGELRYDENLRIHVSDSKLE